MMREEVYLIEFGGEKELNEMDALELQSTDNAIQWIEESIESDSEYYNINIECEIYRKKDKALAYVKYESIVNEEMFNSDIYDVRDIITSDLSIVSKIVKKFE